MPTREKWAPAIFDREAFLCFLEGASVKGTSEVTAQSLSGTSTAASDASMFPRTNHRVRLPVYWWNKEIAVIREVCLRARRLHHTAVRVPLYDELTTRYEQKRKELKIAIKTAKRKCWQDFYEEVDSDPWERPYKTVINKINPRGTCSPSCPNFLYRVVQNLFLQHQERQHGTGLTERIGTAEPTAVTESEMKIADKKIAIRKAPGLDGEPGLAI